MINQNERSGHVGFLILLSVTLAAVSLALTIMSPDKAAPYVQVLLGVLSMVGVFALFSVATGLITFGIRKKNSIAPILIETLEDGLLVLDTAGRIILANAAYLRMFNICSIKEVASLERIFAGDPSLVKPMFRLSQAARERTVAAEEIRTPPLPVRSLIGNEEDAKKSRWYRINVQPVEVDESWEVSTFSKDLTLWRIVDITIQRQEQEQEFQELQQAVTFLDNAPAGFFSADTSGNVNYINATLSHWLEYDLAQTNSWNLKVQDFLQGYVVPWLETPVLEAVDIKTSVMDVDLIKKSGHKLPVRLLHRYPPVDANRDIARDSLTLVLNRSAGEEISEELRAAEVRFARFFNSTPIAIASINRDGKISRANAPFLKLFAGIIDANDISSNTLMDCVIDSDQEKVVRAISEAINGQGDVCPIEVQFVTQSQQRFVRFFVSSVEDGADDEEAAIVYGLETTKQRELEQQFAQSQKMQGIGQLAGGIAHDFNNVLTAIIGFSDLLLANRRPTDPSFQDIMNIKQNANRAASLVGKLLAFSRRQILCPEVIVLTDTIADLSVMLDRLLGEKVELKVIHGRDLWPIKADTIQLEQVIVNLALNARDAMSDGGKVIISTNNITAGSKFPYATTGMPDADYVSITVSDTGTGIPPELLEKIFEPFFTTKTTGCGTGLGLSTVYGIVKQTGGYIYCSSVLGEGTTFRIFLPRYHEVEEPKIHEEVNKGLETKSQVTDLTGSATILLVEDEESVRAFAKRALESRGYTVYEAASGAQALGIMKKKSGAIDLVVSDVVMPEIDGPTLLKELRKTRPDLKIIFVSGYAEEAFAKNLPDGEHFHFLPKPITLKQLVVAVKSVLGL